MKQRSLEIELKLQVQSAGELERIAMVAGGEREPPITQTNHFFDTPEHMMHKTGMGLRLRREAQEGKEDRLLLALKGERHTDDKAPALVRRKEIEVLVDEDTARLLLQGEIAPLPTLMERAQEEDVRFLKGVVEKLGAPLNYIGHFQNSRVRMNTILVLEGDGIEIVLELDTTTYPKGSVYPEGIVEYEVEVELPEWVPGESAEMALRSILAIAGVKGHTARGKAVRYFERL